MKRSTTLVALIALALITLRSAGAQTNGLRIYGPVPGLASSNQYRFRVRIVGTGEKDWRAPFAFITTCKTTAKEKDAYFPELAGWSHTYINFEMDRAVEVEVSRFNDQPIRTAVAHPTRKVGACVVRNGKAYVRVDRPCLVAIDIDGQMDRQDTGKTPTGRYNGPPIHTLSIFANPPISDRPQPTGPGVFAVKPGETPPSDGPWKTLYFLPGIHDIGLAFPVHAERKYYIPGDAIVYGTFSNRKWEDGHDIRIFGLGTISGARLTHPGHVVPAIPGSEQSRYDPVEIVGATDTRVEGVTLADSAHHSLMLVAGYSPSHPTDVHWVKIFTWRANGDGINPFGNVLVEDCFLRTQDDSLYVSGRGIRRTVLWNDANGSSFVLSSLPQLTDRTLTVEDCDVIYSRASWHHWTGGRVFNMRGEGSGPCGTGVIFRNINVEDQRPTLQQFFVAMSVPKPYSNEAIRRKPGDLAGVLFQNISIAAPGILGEPQILWGDDGARIRHLTFENLTVGGHPVQDASFFKTNSFVSDLIFRQLAQKAP